MVIDSPLKTLYTIDYKIVKIFIIMNINENISRIKEIMGLVNEADSSVTTTTTQYNRENQWPPADVLSRAAVCTPHDRPGRRTARHRVRREPARRCRGPATSGNYRRKSFGHRPVRRQRLQP